MTEWFEESVRWRCYFSLYSHRDEPMLPAAVAH